MVLMTIIKKFEDKNFPLLGPNLFGLSLTGLSLRNKQPWSKFCSISIPLFVVFVASMIYNLYTVLDDETKVVENIRVTIPMFMVAVKVIYFCIIRKKLIIIVKTVSELEKAQIEYEDSDVLLEMDRYTKYARKLTVRFFLILFISMTVIGGSSVVNILVSYVNGKLLVTETPHLFSTRYSYMFDKSVSPGFWFGLTYDMSMGYYSVIAHSFWDLFVVTIMIFFAGQLRISRLKCSKIFDGAPQAFKGNLVECHMHHLSVVKFAKQLNEILGPVMFIYFIVSSLDIGTIAIMISKDQKKGNLVDILSSVQVFIAIFFQLLLFYWHSNQVLYASTQVVDGALQSNWYSQPKNTRKDFLILLQGLKIEIVFNAGPFHKMTTSTFLMTFKAAYSYFALLNNKPVKKNI